MRPTNRHGTPVDPVPFIVTASATFLVMYSYGPGYLLSLGVALPEALGTITVAWVAIVAGSYHQMVWTARPELRAEVPARVRFRRLFYAVLIGIAIIALLLLPLLVR